MTVSEIKSATLTVVGILRPDFLAIPQPPRGPYPNIIYQDIQRLSDTINSAVAQIAAADAAQSEKDDAIAEIRARAGELFDLAPPERSVEYPMPPSEGSPP